MVDAHSQGSADEDAAHSEALKMLARRAHSVAEVRLRLSRKGFDAASISCAIARLSALGYLDDAVFAREKARSLFARSRLGPQAVQERLIALGVEGPIASAAVREAMAETSERTLAERFIARYPGLTRESPPASRLRAARKLLSRGFSSATVEALLGPLESLCSGRGSEAAGGDDDV
jgi:regulatory protein